jgi:hypothetical protein
VIEQRGITAKGFIACHPATAQGPRLDDGLDHRPAQHRLGGEDDLLRYPARRAPLGVGRVVDPFLGQIQAAIQQRRAVLAGIAQQHTSLAVGPLAQRPAILPLHPRRMAPLLGKIAAIDQQDALVFAQVFLDFLPVLGQERVIVPRPCTHEGLHRPHRIGVHAFQRQHHRFNRLARQLRQQALEIRVRRLALFTPLKQGTVEPMVVAQRLHELGNVLHCQVDLGCGVDHGGHSALLPIMVDGQNYTTFQNLVVVLTSDHFRHNALSYNTDSLIATFWVNEYQGWDKKFRSEAISPLLNKLRSFFNQQSLEKHVMRTKQV